MTRHRELIFCLHFCSSTRNADCRARAFQSLVFEESLLLRLDLCRFASAVRVCVGLCSDYLSHDGTTARGVPSLLVFTYRCHGNADIAGIRNDCWSRVRSQSKLSLQCESLLSAIELHNQLFAFYFRAQLGVVVGPFVIAPFVVFSGFFLRLADAPAGLHWLFHASYLKYAVEGLSHAIFGYNRPKLKCNEIYCHYQLPTKFMKMVDMHHNDFLSAFTVLLVICVVLRILAFFIMALRLKKR